MRIVHIHFRTSNLHVYLSDMLYTPDVGVEVPTEQINAFIGLLYFPCLSFLYTVTVLAP